MEQIQLVFFSNINTYTSYFWVFSDPACKWQAEKSYSLVNNCNVFLYIMDFALFVLNSTNIYISSFSDQGVKQAGG